VADQPLDNTGFLKLIIDALQAGGVEYLIGGAIAELAWGEPRATQDIDIVINVSVEAVARLSEELEKRDMLLPGDMILDAILEDQADIPLSAIHLYSGLKADFYPVRTGDEMRASGFRRRVRVDYGPPIGEVYVQSPGDLIVYKLGYFATSRQSKHSRDIAAILRARRDSLDLDYLEGWVTPFGLHPLWEEILGAIV